jgi:hypothetical protein
MSFADELTKFAAEKATERVKKEEVNRKTWAEHESNIVIEAIGAVRKQCLEAAKTEQYECTADVTSGAKFPRTRGRLDYVTDCHLICFDMSPFEN